MTIDQFRALNIKANTVINVKIPNESHWVILREVISDLGMVEKLKDMTWRKKCSAVSERIAYEYRMYLACFINKGTQKLKTGEIVEVISLMPAGYVLALSNGKQKKYNPISFDCVSDHTP